jgi:hypothetical protein
VRSSKLSTPCTRKHTHTLSEEKMAVLKDPRQLFHQAFAAVDIILRQHLITSSPEALYSNGSSLVRVAAANPEYSNEGRYGAVDLQIEDSGSKGPHSPSVPFGSDLPIHSRILKLPEQATVNQLAFVTLYNLAVVGAAEHPSISNLDNGEQDSKTLGARVFHAMAGSVESKSRPCLVDSSQFRPSAVYCWEPCWKQTEL